MKKWTRHERTLFRLRQVAEANAVIHLYIRRLSDHYLSVYCDFSPHTLQFGTQHALSTL